jgi:hypothetical protein
MENRKLSFETNVHAWKRSSSCRLLELHLENILATRKVTKIICLGLGDFCRKEPPGSMALGNSHLSKEELGAAMIRSRIVQHAIAMTMVKTCERLYGKAVQLLAQDPDYTEEAKTILQAYGFSIVGESGAGGFAEIDDHSGVFSAFISAPLKQIIADIGRPPLVISTSAIVMDG